MPLGEPPSAALDGAGRRSQGWTLEEPNVEIIVMLMASLAPFVIVVAIIGLAIWWNQHQSRQRDQIWGQVAAGLGLHYANSEIWGRRHGQSIRVGLVSRGSGKNKTTYTVASSVLNPPLDLGLSVQRHGFFNDLFQGGHDIQVGDPAFDGRFIIQGDEDHRVRALLATELRQLLLGRLGGADFSLSDRGMSVERHGATNDGRWLGWAIEMCSQTTHLLSRARFHVPVASALAWHSQAWAAFARANGLRGVDTPLCMWGELEGTGVHAYAARVGTRAYQLEVRVSFSPSLGVGLAVQPTRTFDRVAIFFGSQDHKLGDPAFDETFVVKAASAHAVGQVLDARLRAQLLELHRTVGATSLYDDALVVRLPTLPRHPAVVPQTVHRMAALAEAVGARRHPGEHVGPYR